MYYTKETGRCDFALTDVSKAEYDEYNSDFGELTESVSYDDMYLTLDKAYEKYLSE